MPSRLAQRSCCLLHPLSLNSLVLETGTPFLCLLLLSRTNDNLLCACCVVCCSHHGHGTHSSLPASLRFLPNSYPLWLVQREGSRGKQSQDGSPLARPPIYLTSTHRCHVLFWAGVDRCRLPNGRLVRARRPAARARGTSCRPLRWSRGEVYGCIHKILSMRAVFCFAASLGGALVACIIGLAVVRVFVLCACYLPFEGT